MFLLSREIITIFNRTKICKDGFLICKFAYYDYQTEQLLKLVIMILAQGRAGLQVRPFFFFFKQISLHFLVGYEKIIGTCLVFYVEQNAQWMDWNFSFLM